MSDLHAVVDDYLHLRRALGFKLAQHGRLLPDLVAFLEAAGAATVTTDLAVAWACQPVAADPSWWAQRLGVARGFARHLHSLDPGCEVPAADLLPRRARRPAPHLYSDAEIDVLMAEAGKLSPPLRAGTLQTLIGLLAVTGLRPGEALRLRRHDIDWSNATLTVIETKFNKSRVVVLHPSTLHALRAYADQRDRSFPEPAADRFFVSASGGALVHTSIDRTFADVVRRAGLSQPAQQRPPRLADARHSFAVKTLIGWYHADVDVEARLPLLATWLGHAEVANTYWYLSAAPELLALAADRRRQPRKERS